MKDLFSQFIDFITGGFFNVLGAVVRLPFSKKKYGQLLQESASNYAGMVVMTVILAVLYLSYKYYIRSL